MKRHIRTYISIFLLILFQAYLSVTTLFPHDHIVNGVKVVHSHPYSNNQHSHSESQICTIAHLSTFNGFEAHSELISFNSPLTKLIDSCSRYVQPFILRAECRNISLRAPPAC